MYSTMTWQMINLAARKIDGIQRTLGALPRAWECMQQVIEFYIGSIVIFLAHSNSFARSKSIFHGHGSSFPVVSRLPVRGTSSNAETARKISTLPQRLVSMCLGEDQS